MNKDVLFSSKSDLWETPQNLFDKLDQEFGFTLDVCAIPENAKCQKFYTPEQDGLKMPWNGTVWCNPPYGRQVGLWVRRALFAAYIYKRNGVEIRFLRGRLRFGGVKRPPRSRAW